MSRRYAELVQMADEELTLAACGHWQELDDALRRREQCAAALPATPPESARPLLRRLAAMHAELDTLLAVNRRSVAIELGALRRGRGALRGYQAGGAERGSRIDGAA